MSGFVLGISGSTCAGKTTLAKALEKLLGRHIRIHYLNQDSYYYEEDSGKHVYLPDVGMHNWEIPSAFDNGKMGDDVGAALKDAESNSNKWITIFCKLWKVINDVEENDSFSAWIHEVDKKMQQLNDSRLDLTFVVLEGILIFNDRSLHDLCDAKIFLKLDDDVCKGRRNLREYEPPDVPGYYEKIVRPHYEKHLRELEEEYDDIKYLDGGSLINNFKSIIQEILRLLNHDRV